MMDVKRRKILTAVAQTLINECDEPFMAEHVSAFVYNNIKSASKRKILAVGAAVMTCNLVESTDGHRKRASDISETRRRFKMEKTNETSYFSFNPTDGQFRELFRVDKSTFEILLKSLAVVFHPPDKPTHPCSLQPKDKLLLMLYILGTQDSFRNIANKFNLNTGNCYCIYMNFCNQLNTAVKNFISWPKDERRQNIKETFSEIYGFENVVGIVGNICIPIKHPTSNTERCEDVTGYYSVSLQAVCDHQMKFNDISTGWVGSMNSVNIWKNSRLYQQLQSKQSDVISPEEHLIGTEEYPLDEFIMTPYVSNTELSLDQLHYNSIHKEMTSLIEKAFNQFVGRFCRLKLMDVSVLEKISKIITAACIFHNVIMETESQQEDIYNYEPDTSVKDKVEVNLLQSYNDIATAKRNKICYDLMSIKD